VSCVTQHEPWTRGPNAEDVKKTQQLSRRIVEGFLASFDLLVTPTMGARIQDVTQPAQRLAPRLGAQTTRAEHSSKTPGGALAVRPPAGCLSSIRQYHAGGSNDREPAVRLPKVTPFRPRRLRTRHGGGSRPGTHRPRRVPSAPGRGSGRSPSGTRPRASWSHRSGKRCRRGV
jgi:hypothetical protein